MTRAVQELADRGIQARVVEAEVIKQTDPGVLFTMRLLSAVEAFQETSTDRTTKTLLPLHSSRVHALLHSEDLSNAQIDRIASGVEAEAMRLVAEINAQVSKSVSARLRAWLATHHIPSLSKETP